MVKRSVIRIPFNPFDLWRVKSQTVLQSKRVLSESNEVTYPRDCIAMLPINDVRDKCKRVGQLYAFSVMRLFMIEELGRFR